MWAISVWLRLVHRGVKELEALNGHRHASVGGLFPLDEATGEEGREERERKRPTRPTRQADAQTRV